VSGDDSGLFVVLSGVSGQLQDFSSQVLENGSQVDGGSGSDSVAVSAALQESVDSSDGELESSSRRSRSLLRSSGFSLSLSFSSDSHFFFFGKNSF